MKQNFYNNIFFVLTSPFDNHFFRKVHMYVSQFHATPTYLSHIVEEKKNDHLFTCAIISSINKRKRTYVGFFQLLLYNS